MLKIKLERYMGSADVQHSWGTENIKCLIGWDDWEGSPRRLSSHPSTVLAVSLPTAAAHNVDLGRRWSGQQIPKETCALSEDFPSYSPHGNATCLSRTEHSAQKAHFFWERPLVGKPILFFSSEALSSAIQCSSKTPDWVPAMLWAQS